MHFDCRKRIDYEHYPKKSSYVPGERDGVIPCAGVLHGVHGLPNLAVDAVLLVAVGVHQTIEVEEVREAELGDGGRPAARGIVEDLPDQERSRDPEAEAQRPRGQGRAVLIGQ